MTCNYTLITDGKYKYSLKVDASDKNYSGITDFFLYIRNQGSVIKTRVPAIKIMYEGKKILDIPYKSKEVIFSDAIDFWTNNVKPVIRSMVIEKEFNKEYASKCKELCSKSFDYYDLNSDKSEIIDIYNDAFSEGFRQACKLFLGEKLDGKRD